MPVARMTWRSWKFGKNRDFVEWTALHLAAVLVVGLRRRYAGLSGLRSYIHRAMPYFIINPYTSRVDRVGWLNRKQKGNG